MRVPKGLPERLKNYDSSLRLRWSKEKKVFVLERKVRKAFLPKPVFYRTNEDGRLKEIKCPEDSERYIQYRDGYIGLFEVPRIVNQESFMQNLYRGEVRMKSGNILKSIEIEEEKKERMEKLKSSETLREITGESYDHLRWAQGERIAV